MAGDAHTNTSHKHLPHMALPNVHLVKMRKSLLQITSHGNNVMQCRAMLRKRGKLPCHLFFSPPSTAKSCGLRLQAVALAIAPRYGASYYSASLAFLSRP